MANKDFSAQLFNGDTREGKGTGSLTCSRVARSIGLMTKLG